MRVLAGGGRGLGQRTTLTDASGRVVASFEARTPAAVIGPVLRSLLGPPGD